MSVSGLKRASRDLVRLLISVGLRNSSLKKVLIPLVSVCPPLKNRLLKLKYSSVPEKYGKPISYLSNYANLVVANMRDRRRHESLHGKPKLAYLSPILPQRSGIAKYTDDLLRELKDHYSITVIIPPDCSHPEFPDGCERMSTAEYVKNFSSFDRVLYHFGNSSFHVWIYELFQTHPGVVVLHDFYLGGMLSEAEMKGGQSGIWMKELWDSHGYEAIRERFRNVDVTNVIKFYPANRFLFTNSLGIIVHSNYSKELALEWFGSSEAARIEVVPLLKRVENFDPLEAKANLGFAEDDLLVCCFGYLSPNKLNLEIVKAWQTSKMGRQANTYLVFVGDLLDGDYKNEILDVVKRSANPDKILITGWTSPEVYKKYLEAADIAVQLRSNSRGETSAALLDCLAYGKPTVINSHGAMSEIPETAVIKLPEFCTPVQISNALDSLWEHDDQRKTLTSNAPAYISRNHSPCFCAQRYYDSIEKFYNLNSFGGSCSRTTGVSPALPAIVPETRSKARLYLDVTGTHQNDLKTGIERVSKSLVKSLIEVQGKFEICPVYLHKDDGVWHYRHAHYFTMKLFDLPGYILSEKPAQIQKGDIVLGLDISGPKLIEAQAQGLLEGLRGAGVKVYFFVYDLLPVKMPQYFPPGSAYFGDWLRAVSTCDGAICDSKAVADELQDWLMKNKLLSAHFSIKWNHLGADFKKSGGLIPPSKKTAKLLNSKSNDPMFLMVGTIEPRKGHSQVLDAFSQLWSKGVNANLIIVGREGWLGLPSNERKAIVSVVNKISRHPLKNSKLFWFNDANDKDLELLYSGASCLIAASEGEGFGLPLIEAALNELPILAREIPVFREVAASNADYFTNTLQSERLADEISAWLEKYRSNQHCKPNGMHFCTWSESAVKLLKVLEQLEGPI